MKRNNSLQILNHVMTTWKLDRPKALGLLQVPTHQILKDANASQDLVSILEQQGIDQLLLRDADPALAMNLLQVLCDSCVFFVLFFENKLPKDYFWV